MDIFRNHAHDKLNYGSVLALECAYECEARCVLRNTKQIFVESDFILARTELMGLVQVWVQKQKNWFF